MKPVLIGADDAGFYLKEDLKVFLKEIGQSFVDVGCHSAEPVDYPLIATKACEALLTGPYERALLICGTGIGMAICANKFPGVRAAVCHDVYSAERARKSNNAQVMTLGARVIGSELAKTVVKAWLASEFSGGASAQKVAEIDELDKKYRTQGAGSR